MFMVDVRTAAAIRRAYEEGGELAGAVEFRRHFPLISDHAKARECVRIIAGWQPCREGEAMAENARTTPSIAGGCTESEVQDFLVGLGARVSGELGLGLDGATLRRIAGAVIATADRGDPYATARQMYAQLIGAARVH